MGWTGWSFSELHVPQFAECVRLGTGRRIGELSGLGGFENRAAFRGNCCDGGEERGLVGFSGGYERGLQGVIEQVRYVERSDGGR